MMLARFSKMLASLIEILQDQKKFACSLQEAGKSKGAIPETTEI